MESQRIKYLLKTHQIFSQNKELLAEIEAPNFEIACSIYELKNTLNHIENCIIKDKYIENKYINYQVDITKYYKE